MEIWRDIKGYEGLYQVSNTGKILSLHYRRSNQSKLLPPRRNNKGYLWIELWKNGKAKQLLIHRLVAEAFIPNPNNLPIVNHCDENPLNNVVANLEWCTSSYNNKYSRDKHPERMRTPYKHTLAINQIDLDGNVIHSFENISTVVKQMNYNGTSIKECCEHKRKTAYGYRWEFAL